MTGEMSIMSHALSDNTVLTCRTVSVNTFIISLPVVLEEPKKDVWVLWSAFQDLMSKMYYGVDSPSIHGLLLTCYLGLQEKKT